MHSYNQAMCSHETKYAYKVKPAIMYIFSRPFWGSPTSCKHKVYTVNVLAKLAVAYLHTQQKLAFI